VSAQITGVTPKTVDEWLFAGARPRSERAVRDTIERYIGDASRHIFTEESAGPQAGDLDVVIEHIRRELARVFAKAPKRTRQEIVRHLKAQVTLLANLARYRGPKIAAPRGTASGLP